MIDSRLQPQRGHYRGSYGVDDVIPWIGDVAMNDGATGEDSEPTPEDRTYDFGKYGKFRSGNGRVDPGEWYGSLVEDVKPVFNDAFREATGYDYGTWQAMTERGYATDISLGQVTDITKRMTNPAYGEMMEGNQTSLESGEISSWEVMRSGTPSMGFSTLSPDEQLAGTTLSPDDIKDWPSSRGYPISPQAITDNANNPNYDSPYQRVQRYLDSYDHPSDRGYRGPDAPTMPLITFMQTVDSIDLFDYNWHKTDEWRQFTPLGYSLSDHENTSQPVYLFSHHLNEYHPERAEYHANAMHNVSVAYPTLTGGPDPRTQKQSAWEDFFFGLSNTNPLDELYKVD
jgi:hypothetical protein